MVFSSFSFLFLFLTALLALYYVQPARWRGGRNLVLLLFSLFFYLCGGPKYLLLMLASILINYLSSLLVEGGRKSALVLSMGANLALLGYFKYAGFLMENLQALGLPVEIPSIALPVGISFFTFQGMSYVIDVYRGDAKADRSILGVALYISLFPQLVAGPIVRYTTVAHDLRHRRETFQDFYAGAIRFCFGLAKKMLLANNLGMLADEAFSAAGLTASAAWLGALGYTGQIYFDFSGYSDMAIGLGRMFGFRFEENFHYPYLSRSITEFWRRWHMSLSGWFRDYVYIPLGGSRCGLGKQIRNVLVVWMLTGIWHGAAWNFFLWGLYFALLLLGERFVWKNLLNRSPQALRHLYAMVLIVLGWVLFRCTSLAAVGQYLGAMAGLSEGPAGQSLYFVKQYGFWLLAGTAASLPVKDWLAERLPERTKEWAVPVTALLLLGLSFLQLISSTFNPFIYYRF